MIVAICGLGLVGGSLARALTRAGHEVIGVDHPGPCRNARSARAIARAVSLERAAAEADVIVLAAPPAANRRLLLRLARIVRPGSVITDVGSVKGPIVREASSLGLAAFVGGHPMAGRERAGFAASSADLFQGRPWIVTPAASRRAESVVLRLVRAAGGEPVRMTAEEHDRVVAFVSHVPQVVARALFEAARRDPVVRRRLGVAGPAFQGMTRLAKSPRKLWREILGENRRELARALRAFARALSREGLWG